MEICDQPTFVDGKLTLILDFANKTLDLTSITIPKCVQVCIQKKCQHQLFFEQPNNIISLEVQGIFPKNFDTIKFLKLEYLKICDLNIDFINIPKSLSKLELIDVVIKNLYQTDSQIHTVVLNNIKSNIQPLFDNVSSLSNLRNLCLVNLQHQEFLVDIPTQIDQILIQDCQFSSVNVQINYIEQDKCIEFQNCQFQNVILNCLFDKINIFNSNIILFQATFQSQLKELTISFSSDFDQINENYIEQLINMLQQMKQLIKLSLFDFQFQNILVVPESVQFLVMKNLILQDISITSDSFQHIVLDNVRFLCSKTLVQIYKTASLSRKLEYLIIKHTTLQQESQVLVFSSNIINFIKLENQNIYQLLIPKLCKILKLKNNQIPIIRFCNHNCVSLTLSGCLQDYKHLYHLLFYATDLQKVQFDNLLIQRFFYRTSIQILKFNQVTIKNISFVQNYDYFNIKIQEKIKKFIQFQDIENYQNLLKNPHKLQINNNIKFYAQKQVLKQKILQIIFPDIDQI
ncbi:hypothetical protein SS50377_28371 [Spironucleus salmonicida]|uniref:Uncharacterized protein n=1 Tax=Spironucleus salmonicida TaxID=348837 RepID=A0A9P8LJR3_9EUKA|nr:hypothetical protein SS50377_28371 [Spironucleus salmonicida]